MKTRYFAMSALVVLAVALLAGRLPEARAVGDDVFGFGTLRTDFTPAAVANKGGWRIVGQTGFQRSGAAVMLPAFSYQVEFRGVPGFDSPPRQTVVVEKDKTTVINAAYTISAGRLTVTLDPGDARAAGAGWRVVGETGFHFSEATVTLPPGSYVVEFQSAAGFGLPQRKTVAVASRRTTELFVDYPPPPGNPLASLPNLQLSRAGTVSAMVVQPDGDVIVGGQFTAVNDVARNNLARLHADGTLDETWNPSADDAVYALHLEGPNLFVGGAFTLIAGQRRPALALLDAATGALRPVFDAGLAGATEPRPPPIENLGSNDRDDPTLRTYVKTFVRHGDHLFIGGSFTSSQGELHSRLAKLSATDGSPDPAWVPPAPNSFVLKLLPLGDQLYVAGRFGRFGSVALRGLARVTLDGKGALDSRWRPLKLTGQQYIAAVATDGTDLFAGGGDAATEFSDNILAKLSTAGEGSIVKRWETLSPVELLEVRDGKFYFNELSRVVRADAGGSGAIDTAWNAGSSKIGNNFYRALAFPDGAILLAGTTTETTAFFPTGRSLTAVAQSLSKVDPVTGDRDPAHRVRIEVRGKINALVRQPDGQIVVGGDFQFANGVSRLNVLRLSADGHLDATWNPGVGGAVGALAVTETDLFIGGQFDFIGSATRSGLAKLPFAAGGDVDPLWQGATSNGSVLALVIAGDSLYAGGDFELAGAGTADQFGPNGRRKVLAKFSVAGAGDLDTAWRPFFDASGSDFPQIFALAVSDDHLFVGGHFRAVNREAHANLAKLRLTGSDPLVRAWRPETNGEVRALVATPALGQLYVGGFFSRINERRGSRLARVSVNGVGKLDAAWHPAVPDTIGALAVAGNSIYVGGSFRQAGGLVRSTLARLGTGAPGDADPGWDFSPTDDDPERAIFALLPVGNTVFAGGLFDELSGVPRQSLALLATIAAPVITQNPQNPAQIFLQRSPLDGPAVTHFRLDGVTGGTLLRADGVTLVTVGEVLSVEEGAAGLTFAAAGAGPRTITASALAGDDPLRAASGPMTSFTFDQATPPVIFEFSESNYFVREGAGSVEITVLKKGVVDANVTYETADGTALSGANGLGDYERRTGTLGFAGVSVQTFTVPINSDAVFRADRTFNIVLSEPSIGSILGARAVATVKVIDDDFSGTTASMLTTSAPPALGPRTASLRIDLAPAAAAGQWRLVGERNWRNGGTAVSGLVTGVYRVEFKPVSSYEALPPSAIAVLAGEAPHIESFTYLAGPPPTPGALLVRLRPGPLADPANAAGGRWRPVGDPLWHLSGETLTLGGGLQEIEFRPVAGYVTPARQLIRVDGAGQTETEGDYFPAASLAGDPPTPLPVDDATGLPPFYYNGQIRTGGGAAIAYGSGFVVQERVALTAGHVVFDDRTLSFVNDVQWLWRRSAGDYEPPPISPRGWYVFDDYASGREREGAQATPGLSTPASQARDVAALFFVGEKPAGGGAGGYARTAQADSEWLLSARNKMLVGYPVESPDDAAFGRMHATTPANLVFTRLYAGQQVYATESIRSFGGNSGGPLYVQENGAWFPAAVYVAGEDRTVVRAIDAEVVDLINRATTSANGDPNAVGGGITIVQPGATAQQFSVSYIAVDLGPPAAVAAGAAWRIEGDAGFFASGAQRLRPSARGAFRLEFRKIPGFDVPAPRIVEFSDQPVFRIPALYTPAQTRPEISGILTRTGVRGADFSYRIATLKDDATSFTASGFPSGLSFNASTGSLAGRPSVGGEFSVALGAANSAGSGSAILRLTVLESGRLNVTTEGAGNVLPTRFAGLTVQGQGRAVELEARPRPGYVFDGWTGDKPFDRPTLSFTMPQAFSATAHFILNPFPAVRGMYSGLLMDTVGGASGVVQLTITSAGSFTGQLQIGRTAFALAGRFDNRGDFTTDATDALPFALELHLDLTAGSGTVSGTLRNVAGLSHTFSAGRAVFDPATNPRPPAGAYTVVLPADPTQTDGALYPQGHGFGTLRLTSAGVLRMTGRLGDSTAISQGVPLSAQAQWPFYAAPYVGGGSVSGVVSFRDLPASDLDGTLVWRKTPAPQTLYPGGFAGTIALRGARYTPDFAAFNPLSVTFAAGAIANPPALTLNLRKRGNQAIGTAENLTLRIDLTSGLASGKFTLGDASVSYPFAGVLLDKVPSGLGFFLGGLDQTGSLQLAPASP